MQLFEGLETGKKAKTISTWNFIVFDSHNRWNVFDLRLVYYVICFSFAVSDKSQEAVQREVWEKSKGKFNDYFALLSYHLA